MRQCFAGVDTSNYTTSVGLVDEAGRVIANVAPAFAGRRGKMRPASERCGICAHKTDAACVGRGCRSDEGVYSGGGRVQRKTEKRAGVVYALLFVRRNCRACFCRSLRRACIFVLASVWSYRGGIAFRGYMEDRGAYVSCVPCFGRDNRGFAMRARVPWL